MKRSILLLALLLGMCFLIALILMTPEVENGHGYPHATFGESMEHGGSGLARHARVRWYGLAFGILQIAFFVVCLTLGLRRTRGAMWIYVLTGVGYALVFTSLVVADAYYVRDADPALYFGFPLPTFLMLFGLGGVPFIFVFFYIVNFNRWILDPEDLERFRKSLQNRRQTERKV